MNGVVDTIYTGSLWINTRIPTSSVLATPTARSDSGYFLCSACQQNRHVWRLRDTETRYATEVFLLMTFSFRAAIGALFGITIAYLLGATISEFDGIAIVAPMGASAVLAFAVPASPLATPRAIILGNTLSAMVGVGVSLVPGVPLSFACGLSVCLAIVVMSMTRSLHPPGGASALTATLLHPAAHSLTMGLVFPFFPVALNAIVLTGAAILYHRTTGHRYPHVPGSLKQPVALKGHFTRDDIHMAFGNMPDTLDVEERDIEMLINLAEQAATARLATHGGKP